MTRLVDLDPRWLTDGARITGLTFNCPCAKCGGQGCLLAVRFTNPIGGGEQTPNDETKLGNNSGKRWQRKGDTFEALSIEPSIDATKDAEEKPLPPERQHWHGYIRNGGVTP